PAAGARVERRRFGAVLDDDFEVLACEEAAEPAAPHAVRGDDARLAARLRADLLEQVLQDRTLKSSLAGQRSPPRECRARAGCRAPNTTGQGAAARLLAAGAASPRGAAPRRRTPARRRASPPLRLRARSSA